MLIFDGKCNNRSTLMFAFSSYFDLYSIHAKCSSSSCFYWHNVIIHPILPLKSYSLIHSLFSFFIIATTSTPYNPLHYITLDIHIGLRKVIRVKKKKYLVKWRGLSYRDCTWETVKDVNDDVKIAEYHKLNDNPPDEPPLTQAEIGEWVGVGVDVNRSE